MEQKKHTIHLIRQVLKAREWTEETARTELHEANAQLEQQETTRDSINGHIAQNVLAIRSVHGSTGSRVDLDQLQRLRAWQDDRHAALCEAQSAVDQSAERADDAREQLGDLVAERRVLQTLQDRLAEQAAVEQARAQARLSDEAFAAGLARRQDDEDGTR